MTMNYTFETNLTTRNYTHTVHAEVTPTMQALGDQPWQVRLRSAEGDLLLSCTVEDSSALGAACAAVDTLLEAKHVQNKSYSIR